MDTGERCRACRGGVIFLKEVTKAVVSERQLGLMSFGFPGNQSLLVGKLVESECYCGTCGLTYNASVILEKMRKQPQPVCSVCKGKKEIPCHSFDMEGMLPCAHCKETGIEPVEQKAG